MKKKSTLWLLLSCALLTACGGGQKATAESTSAQKAESASEIAETVSVEEEDKKTEDTETAETAAAAAGEEKLSVPLTMAGGTGKARIESPVEVHTDENGRWIAVLRWSSPNYDFMLVDGERYDTANDGGNSVFEIPLPSPDCILEVSADTVAMSTPHLIDYTLYFGSEAENNEEEDKSVDQTVKEPVAIPDCLTITGEMELQYAEGFSIQYCEDGNSLVTIAGTDQYLVVPEGGSVTAGLPDSVTVLCQPIHNIYLVSSAAMDMFIAADALDSLAFCGLEKNGWYLEEAREAMEAGSLKYAGKYSTPDYESLLAGGCELAIENRMVTHSPEVLEELHNIGIPTIVEQASYEKTPQGRMEWVRLYGLLSGHLEQAESAYKKQLDALDAMKGSEDTGLKVAYFYVTTNKLASIRNANDYIPQMIELAGGRYAFEEYGQNNTASTSTIQLEEFYATALDADIIIYNSSIAGALKSMKDFTDLSPLFADLKAVKNGQVYCTTANIYQSSMKMGEFASDLYGILHDQTEDLHFLYLVK